MILSRYALRRIGIIFFTLTRKIKEKILVVKIFTVFLWHEITTTGRFPGK